MRRVKFASEERAEKRASLNDEALRDGYLSVDGKSFLAERPERAEAWNGRRGMYWPCFDTNGKGVNVRFMPPSRRI